MMGKKRNTITGILSKKLWVVAGGRCEYESCNKLLYRDSLTEQEMNTAYIAHIVSAKPDGPRGDIIRSAKLEFELSNLMLLCDECHRRIDREQLIEHPEERLIQMKADHENRIELVTGITPEKKSHIITYTAKVGKHEVAVSYKQAAFAMMPERFPLLNRSIDLGLKNGVEQDSSANYWNQQVVQLQKSFGNAVMPLFGLDPVQDFSVFAFAPQPLLIKLGTLLSDKYAVNTFQFHRQDSTWKWKKESEIKDFKLIEPKYKIGTPALVFSLSGKVDEKDVKSVLGNECSIWELTIKKPYLDFLKTKELLALFMTKTRCALEEIKKLHSNSPLHIFPAMPVSAAIETGRLWLPKADMSLIIYDKNTINGGFTKALEIRNDI